MFLYESKKPAMSTKSSFSNKNADSGRRVHFNSASCQNNRQEFNFIIQKFPNPTAITPKLGFAAGSPRPPQDYLNEDVDFILKALENYNWRERLEKPQDVFFRCCVNQIFARWTTFLPQFLEYCGFTSYGENQSHTFHRPGKNDDAESSEHRDSKNTPKINSMYEGSPGKRRRRKYNANEEIKRYLRHCAAALKLNYKLDSEIQCYYDDEDKVVYVAANYPNDENKISEIEGKPISECSAVLEHSLKEINESIAEYDSSPIWSRFKVKLLDTFFANKKDKPLLRRLRHALTCPAALSGAKFRIAKSSKTDIPRLHAERKILYYLRSQKNKEDFFLDPLRLGGIRRPCFVCSALCFADMSKVRPGPCWISDAGSKPKDTKEMFLILDAIRNDDHTTYITVDDNEHLTTDYDTESCEGSECDKNTN